MTLPLLLAVVLPVVGGTPWSQLAPCSSPAEMSPFQLELRKRLQINFGLENPYSFHADDSVLDVRVLVQPSFQSERFVTVSTSAEGQSEVVSLKPAASIRDSNLEAHTEQWGQLEVYTTRYSLIEPQELVDINRRRAALDPELAAQIRGLFKTEILGSRYPQSDEQRVILDGTVYEFSTFVLGLGLVCAETHSPDEGSVARQLVELTEALEELASAAEEDRQKSVSQIRSLLEHFDSRLQPNQSLKPTRSARGLAPIR